VGATARHPQRGHLDRRGHLRTEACSVPAIAHRANNLARSATDSTAGSNTPDLRAFGLVLRLRHPARWSACQSAELTGEPVVPLRGWRLSNVPVDRRATCRPRWYRGCPTRPWPMPRPPPRSWSWGRGARDRPGHPARIRQPGRHAPGRTAPSRSCADPPGSAGPALRGRARPAPRPALQAPGDNCVSVGWTWARSSPRQPRAEDLT
jgi:hypothetical protein